MCSYLAVFHVLAGFLFLCNYTVVIVGVLAFAVFRYGKFKFSVKGKKSREKEEDFPEMEVTS
jgi:hypothetical protein